MSASETLRSDRAQAHVAGRTVLGVCLVIALAVLIIVGARLLSGGSIDSISVLLPGVSLAWVAWLGVQTWRSVPWVGAASPRSERPSRRLPRYEPAAGTRSERPSDAGRHINA